MDQALEIIKQLDAFFGGFKDIFSGLGSVLGTIAEWAGLNKKED